MSQGTWQLEIQKARANRIETQPIVDELPAFLTILSIEAVILSSRDTKGSSPYDGLIPLAYI